MCQGGGVFCCSGTLSTSSLVYNASFDDALGLGGAYVLMDLMNNYVSNFPEHITSTQ